jgi:hypothetical protein
MLHNRKSRISNRQPWTKTMTDNHQPTFDNRHTTVRKRTTENDDRHSTKETRQPTVCNQYPFQAAYQEKTTNDCQQPLPVSYSWPGKNNKRLSTNNIQVRTCNAMHAGMLLEYILAKAFLLFVQKTKCFWMYCPWKVHLTSVCGGWRLQSVHFPACKVLKRLLENLRKAPDLKISNRLASMDLFILHFYIHSIIGVFTNTF